MNQICHNGRLAAESAKLAQHLLLNIFSRNPVDRPIIECRIQEFEAIIDNTKLRVGPSGGGY
jgi:hypothetical protein